MPLKIPFLQLGSAVEELRAEIDVAIKRVLDSGWYLLGPELLAMEFEWATWCGTQHCVGVSNGLDAMHLVLKAWGIGPGDEVIVPSNTYIATWLAVTHTGATPVPVEPQDDTCCMNPLTIEKAITTRTKAIMPVHLYGHPCDMSAIMKIAKQYGLKVLEDAAQAHGAEWLGQKIGSHGDAVAWSFYPSKNLGALGDAGAITTDSGELFEKLKALRNYGSAVRYVNDSIGYNNRLEELHAAILRVKIKHLDTWNERRAVIADRYLKELSGIEGLSLPVCVKEAKHAWHLFTIRTSYRNALKDYLENHGISTLIHYPIPPYKQKAYAHLKLQEKSYPIAEKIHDEILSLPLNPHLNQQEQTHVIETIKIFFQQKN